MAPQMCGIAGIYRHEGNVSAEIYEALLMLQHRGQDSAGMVTTNWQKFRASRSQAPFVSPMLCPVPLGC